MKAIVLSRRDFREHDQVISVYTKDLGKQDLLARGIKKITSKNSAYLEPFSFVDIEIIKGKELDYIGSVQPVNYFKNIRQDLQKSLKAQLVVGLINRVVQVEEKDEKLFLLLKSWLEFLDSFIVIPSEKDSSTVISTEAKRSGEIPLLIDAFIIKFLYLLGFGTEKFSNILEKNWDEITNLDFDKSLHKKIYQSLVNNLEFKVSDWA